MLLFVKLFSCLEDDDEEIELIGEVEFGDELKDDDDEVLDDGERSIVLLFSVICLFTVLLPFTILCNRWRLLSLLMIFPATVVGWPWWIF